MAFNSVHVVNWNVGERRLESYKNYKFFVFILFRVDCTLVCWLWTIVFTRRILYGLSTLTIVIGKGLLFFFVQSNEISWLVFYFVFCCNTLYFVWNRIKVNDVIWILKTSIRQRNDRNSQLMQKTTEEIILVISKCYNIGWNN